MELRDYQKEAVDTLFKYWSNSTKPCVIQVSTGGGKSVICSEIVKRTHAPALILQPTKEILEQNYQKLLTAGATKNNLSICSASAGGWEIGGITLATIGTIYKHAKMCQHFKTVIVDEADVVPNDKLNSQYMQFFNNVPRARVIGLTACVDGDTEVLTPKGWVAFKDLRGDEGVFAQWGHTKGEEGKIVFEKASVYRGWSDTINRTGWEKEDTELFFTNGHTFPTLVDWHRFVDRKSGAAKFTDRERWFVSGKGVGDGTSLTPYERLCIALQADGHYDNRYSEVVKKGTHRGKYRFGVEVVKPRKQERLKELLEKSGVANTVSTSNRWYNGLQVYSLEGRVYVDHNAKDLWEVFDITQISYEKAREMVEEMCCWDGTKDEKSGARVFSTTNLRQAEFYQAVGVLGGYMTRISSYTPKQENHSVSYRVWLIDRFTRATAALSPEKNIPWNKPIYCLHTKTGYFVARRNNRVFITGNTPWRNVTHSQRSCGPEVFCRPITRIPTVGCKEYPLKESNYGTWFWGGGVIYRCDIPYLQSRGFLSPTRYFKAKTDWSFLSKNSHRVDFDTNEMTQWTKFEANASRFHQALAYCLKYGLKTIVFSPNIDVSFMLSDIIASAGGSVFTLDSKNDSKKQRGRKMDWFRAPGCKFLVNVGMLGRGVDVPSVDAIIMCRPTKSLSLYVQAIGRCLRIDPSNPNKKATILDLSGNYDRFGRVEDISLGKIEATTRYGHVFKKDAIYIAPQGKRKVWEKVS